MIEARRRLRDVDNVKDFYLEKDIPGLGKNYLMEENRMKAIEIYSFFIQYYALMGLKIRVEEERSFENILEKSSEDRRWEQQRRILKEEFPEKSTKELLQILLKMQEEIAEMVEESKRKDDLRGRKIIDDYDEVHTLAEDDSFVKETWEETKTLKREIQSLINHL